MVVKGFVYANNDLNSGFLSKTMLSARSMDMSSLNSSLTLFVCIKPGSIFRNDAHNKWNQAYGINQTTVYSWTFAFSIIKFNISDKPCKKY